MVFSRGLWFLGCSCFMGGKVLPLVNLVGAFGNCRGVLRICNFGNCGFLGDDRMTSLLSLSETAVVVFCSGLGLCGDRGSFLASKILTNLVLPGLKTDFAAFCCSCFFRCEVPVVACAVFCSCLDFCGGWSCFSSLVVLCGVCCEGCNIFFGGGARVGAVVVLFCSCLFCGEGCCCCFISGGAVSRALP